MKKPVIIFDFDKTLTYQDTIYGYYKVVSGDSILFKLKYPFFLLAALLTKVGFITNNRLKSLGVRLYLKGRKREFLQHKGKEYARNILMNEIYYNDFKKYPKESVIVLSASFEEYLSPIFPEYRIAGSEILYSKDGKASGLKRNMYGAEKVEWLRRMNISKVDFLYTDSYSDKPLMDVSETVYLVKNGIKHELLANLKTEPES